ncbi:MAG: hypothetical protein IJL63_06990 [Clostridia bacterium]|nr:hypothetical protein [Clostridia bacterium]
MTRQEIFDKVVEEIRDCAPELADKELTEDIVINTDTGIDSMGMTLIICRLEAAFDVKIPQRLWQDIMTIGDVVDAFEKRL